MFSEQHKDVSDTEIVKELPQFTQSENELTANAYMNDLGLGWQELKGKVVLDIGAGLARFAQAAKMRGIEVTSVDLHPDWHTDTESKINPLSVPYVVADARKQLPFPDESFDLIVARASIHAMVEVQEDMEDIIKEAKRLLKMGGEFRFGPGSITMRPVRQGEWKRWFDLLKKVQQGKEIPPEEDVWGGKVWPRYEQELKADEELKGLSREERINKLQEHTLINLQNIEPTITGHPITRTLKGWKGSDGKDIQENSMYYTMKKARLI